MNEKTKKQIIDKVVAGIKGDIDISEFGKLGERLANKLIDNCEFTEGSSRDSSLFIRTAVGFDKGTPGGSRADYIGAKVVSGFEGYQVISVNNDYIKEITDNIYETAISPEFEMEFIQPFAK